MRKSMPGKQTEFQPEGAILGVAVAGVETLVVMAIVVAFM
jgi:hypothetical protein